MAIKHRSLPLIVFGISMIFSTIGKTDSCDKPELTEQDKESMVDDYRFCCGKCGIVFLNGIFSPECFAIAHNDTDDAKVVGWKEWKFSIKRIGLHLSEVQNTYGIGVNGKDLLAELVKNPGVKTGYIESLKSLFLSQKSVRSKVMNAHVLDYLLSFPQTIPEGWKNRRIIFWGTIYRYPKDSEPGQGAYYVRALVWGKRPCKPTSGLCGTEDAREWQNVFVSINSFFNADSPAAVYK